MKEKIVSIRGAFDDIVDSWYLKRIIPDEALDSLKNASKKLGEILPKVEQGITQGMQDLEKKFSKALDEYTGGVPALGITNVPNKVKTIELKAPSGNNLPGGQAAKALTKSRKTPDDFTEFKSMNHKKAAAGEYNSHQLMTEKGYTPLGKTDGNYKAGETGIDGIYLHPNPPPYFAITEAKYNKARLGNTKDGKQMSNDWIDEKRLRKAGVSEEHIEEILDSLADNDGMVQKLLIRNKLDNSLVVKELDKNAKIIGKALDL
ncbi:hypothetical protein GCM10009111_34980 [Colwellia asteriadis]|uniref:Uncharacterized protein n=1 Tax=Colwellia asteriadis TaxID=517723 RepID=A0ABN1LBG6_9GAMM